MSTSTISGTVGFLGFGNMGRAIADGMIKAGIVSENQILIKDPGLAVDFAMSLQKKGYQFAESDAQLFRDSSVIILAVKPQTAKAEKETWESLFAGILGAGKTFISIMAGIKATWIREFAPRGSSVIRVMPNLGLSVGEGATAIATDGLSEDSILLAEKIFKSSGQTARVSEEQLDAVTGVSGSGPMYVFEFIEALTQAGMRTGLPRETAYKLAIQTAKGSLKLLETSTDEPSVWSARVRSPGGTTAEAQKVLEQGGFQELMIRAVEAAVKRSKELSGN